MKILSLNVRGLGGQAKQLVLKNLVLSHHLDVIFLQESMLTGITTENILQRLFVHWHFDICSFGCFWVFEGPGNELGTRY
jgi:exonuclease III